MELTIKQALEQGYKYCGYDNGWQSLMEIEDIAFYECDGLFVYSKQSLSPSVSAEEVSDLISDLVCHDHYEDSGDDTNGVLNLVKSIDFDKTAGMINEKLSEYKWWRQTNIRLIP